MLNCRRSWQAFLNSDELYDHWPTGVSSTPANIRPADGCPALLQAFARLAHQSHTELLVASGNCDSYAGLGDPYLPFREILNMLSGDVQARRTAGAISRDQAHRLGQAAPLVIQALLASGPNLIDSFVSGRSLLSRAQTIKPERNAWQQALAE